MLDEASMIQLVGNFGFPIVMTIYLLHRFERKIESLDNTIQNLAKVVGNKGVNS
ncbi:YvrJ family protein [Paenisporosarcina sp. FSL H8-0542]|uniref:YvrJ family protein n=1 Tax=unclassified Paenisporosarcina TaxID=2642018 RepID=UPI00034EB899|nr:YvrJ family protein [Paenisporosarcina sp. HGH0030]EPD51085.1 hypothetical protein HMPREF1210_02276 [Paenisporosarcina sp. HGH0030]